MTSQTQWLRVFEQEDLNFLLTNRIPRRLTTLFLGWFSKIEQPLIRDLSIGLWRAFSGLDLGEAKKTEFRSMHDCFIRELKEGARPFTADPQILASPCDAIVGACGPIAGKELHQIKGFPYTLDDLLCDPALVETHRNGTYVTLRPSFGDKDSIYAYRTEIAWEPKVSSLVFREGERSDAAYEHTGEVAVIARERDAEQQVDAGAGAGRTDRAGDVTIGDVADPGADLADVLRDLGVPGAVQ